MAGRRARGQNEGTVSRRTDGRWEARLTLPGGARRSFYGRTKDEAWEKLEVAKADLRGGVLPPAQRLTLDAFLDAWLEDAVRPAVDPATADSYATVARLYLSPTFGAVRLARCSGRVPR